VQPSQFAQALAARASATAAATVSLPPRIARLDLNCIAAVLVLYCGCAFGLRARRMPES